MTGTEVGQPVVATNGLHFAGQALTAKIAGCRQIDLEGLIQR